MPIAIPIAAAAISGYQAIASGIAKNKARKALENQRTPTYAPDKAIGDYYQAALNKYNVSPYNSNQYQFNKQNTDQNLATGTNSLQDRRSALGGISSLVAGSNNSNLRSAASAENIKANEFNQLGRATGMKSGDSRNAFNINSMMPYNNTRGLYVSQLQGANQMENAGIQGLSNAGQNIGEIALGNGTNGIGRKVTQYGSPKYDDLS